MEALQAEGLTTSIGVSNFRAEDILAMKDSWQTPPAVNQVSDCPLGKTHG
jgi:diketogulonate reductase-like aldo/keto reductase